MNINASVRSGSNEGSNFNNNQAANVPPSSSEYMSRFSSNSPTKFGLAGTAGGTSMHMQQMSPVHLSEMGRRPSGSLSRVQFLHNNSASLNTQSISISNGNIPSNFHPDGDMASLLGNTGSINSQLFSPPTPAPAIKHNTATDRTYFQTSNEILACDRSWETPNLICIATSRNLQLLKVSNSDITLETDLSMKPSGRTKASTISDLAFGHQQYGRYLAASTITGSIHIYHFDRGTRMKTTLSGHNRAVNSIDFNHISPHLLASGSQDGKILIWDLKASNTKPSMTLNCNADAVRCCTFNNKKPNVLAAVFDSGVIEKWDLRKNTSWERRINAHTGPALSVNWHPELDYIATGGRDKQLQIWNLEAGSETREPTHVINTSGPIFKAKWCKGRGNGSIMNTDIAVSFFNDDSSVQIWNLNRKSIPKNVINAHSAPITQLLWRTPKHLISCSKDKTLIQYDVTKEPNFVDNLPNGAFAWSPSTPLDLSFIKQEKPQFEGPFLSTRHNTPSELNTVEEVDSMHANNISMESSGMQFFENKTFGGGHSPTLSSSFKHQRQPILSRQPSYSKPTVKNIPPPAWIMSTHIPLMSNDIENFKFLSTNYMIRVPENSNITEVCEFNSMLAASVGHFRDSQTWKTIKMGIILDLAAKAEEDIESKLQHFTFEHGQTYDGSDSHLDRSYGSESDIAKNKSGELSTSYGSEQYALPLAKDNSDYNESAIVDDTANSEHDEEESANDMQKEESSDIRHSPSKSKTNGQDSELSERGECSSANISRKASRSALSPSVDPIEIGKHPIKTNRSGSNLRQYRYSFTGSSMDLDDEKAGSPLSLSCSPMVQRTRSMLLMSLKNGANDDNPLAIGRSIDTRISRASDNRSQLTAIMKDSNANDFDTGKNGKRREGAEEEGNHPDIRIPWNPSDLIEHASEYSAQQGDILMCATLSLLFGQLYPESIPDDKSEEWIYMYHDYLLRCGFYNNAATIRRIASETYEYFKTVGQTKTSVRTLCCHCMRPVLNDESKERYKSRMKQEPCDAGQGSNKLSFGFWYCDKCRQLQGGCCYCSEPIKGNTVALVGCGHQGHFGCFRSWFIDQKESECPLCGTTCLV